jgi:indolepyruvate ferredoxin oxidoreductase beta subunit
MPPSDGVVNVVFAGLGGQGVLKASDVLAEAVFAAGRDVKKSELHGMSQRGGSVSSDVRIAAEGARVQSPMVPLGEADYLVVLDCGQVDVNRHVLREGGVLITPEVFFDEDAGIEDEDDLDADEDVPVTRRNLNIALCGVLSAHLDVPEEQWLSAIRANLPKAVHAQNEDVFRYGAGVRTA